MAHLLGPSNMEFDPGIFWVFKMGGSAKNLGQIVVECGPDSLGNVSLGYKSISFRSSYILHRRCI